MNGVQVIPTSIRLDTPIDYDAIDFYDPITYVSPGSRQMLEKQKEDGPSQKATKRTPVLIEKKE